MAAADKAVAETGAKLTQQIGAMKQQIASMAQQIATMGGVGAPQTAYASGFYSGQTMSFA